MKNGLVVLHPGPRPVDSLRAQAGPLFWKDQAVPTASFLLSLTHLTAEMQADSRCHGPTPTRGCSHLAEVLVSALGQA